MSLTVQKLTKEGKAMKRYWILILWMGLWACDSATPEQADVPISPMIDSSLAVDFFQKETTKHLPKTVFMPLLDSSFYTRRDSFAAAFRRLYQVPSKHNLLDLQVTRLYGSPDSLFWLRFSNSNLASDCAHPALEQHFIFDHKGQLLYQNYVNRAQFLANAIDSMPIFLTVEHDCTGEGRHYAYILQEGQLLAILNTLFENMPMTFDANEDNSVFQAAGALEPLVQDVNADGQADLILKGKRLDLYSRSGKRFSVRQPYHREAIKYYFLYEPAKEIFVFAPNFRPASH